jgi:hypothetical protein
MLKLTIAIILLCILIDEASAVTSKVSLQPIAVSTSVDLR